MQCLRDSFRAQICGQHNYKALVPLFLVICVPQLCNDGFASNSSCNVCAHGCSTVCRSSLWWNLMWIQDYLCHQRCNRTSQLKLCSFWSYVQHAAGLYFVCEACQVKEKVNMLEYMLVNLILVLFIVLVSITSSKIPIKRIIFKQWWQKSCL